MLRNKLLYIPMFIIGLLLILVLLSSSAISEKTEVTLGGKGFSGAVFPTASTIANLVNQKSKDEGLHITVKSRRGSLTIIKSVMSGEFEFGLVNSRFVYQAYNGLGEWIERPQKEMRNICNAYPEQIALVASADSGICNIGDLIGKRVFIGGYHSDLFYAVIDLLVASGVDPQTDLYARGAVVEEAPRMMQDDAIDAFFYILGTTNRALIDLFSESRQMVLVPIANIGIDELTATNPFYEKSIIQIELYPYFTNKTDIETVSVKTSLVTSKKVSDSLVYTITKDVLEGADTYITQNPFAKILELHQLTENMPAPVHSGASRFYQESGVGYSLINP